ncbi:CDP-diacylglycerol--inositol 3-phosphatidyltransferase-like [Mizuhopecten yessoensis]|uniref:CDP-diacylglycerol--inositol 3-phosphatidyltransferase n=1 Tax=Mizuhopecten yessoensis TaxID=6573 RepID=A0A210PLU7_MIZYE|nr:CDP-diacylglycerol--inositol 3-phosphatidyltransferase-like [Mizuhopecten yessoensis]OWF37455.1 CDP-diacylglycerol--inositol 3-phosphatidyltransferase [Mizuhopecten yessoensis]
MSENVFLFVPNIIGYIRIICIAVASLNMVSNHWIAVIFYMMASLLDGLDGFTARKLNQCSRFGALLDIITDICVSNVCLLSCLCHLYPQYMVLFQLSMVLEVSSRWLLTQSTAMIGIKNIKERDYTKESRLIELYYKNKVFLGAVCIGNDLFFAMLYLTYFTTGPHVGSLGLFELLMYLSAPFSLVMFAVGVAILILASKSIVRLDISERNVCKHD